MSSKAAKPAEYSPELCKAIVRGLRRHLKMKYGSSRTVPEVQTVLVQEEDEGQSQQDRMNAQRGLDEEEDEEDPHGMEDEESSVDMSKLNTEVALADKNRVRRLHVQLGHPSKPSLLRFLRAGRVRAKILKWVKKDFECQACISRMMPKAPRPAVVPNVMRQA
jgi:hypothetical protein